ncbi:hypothetical protein [Nitrosopumilus adriaticus]|uniref:hypothetical protein n=1 Tax=Nitrosopumilus adriaticus TaxID=1580092 RepID=UPI00352EB13A
MTASNVLAGIGLAVGIIGLAAQLNAPKCPTCGRRVVVINNYCTNCQIHWR